MSSDMSSWRHLASTSTKLAVRSFFSSSALATPISRAAQAVGATDERRQAWRAWASQKFRGRAGSRENSNQQEILTLFPGWAARRYNANPPELHTTQPTPFEVEVFVSGYAISRPKHQGSRSQRAFIRLAKSFAGVPRIPGQTPRSNSSSDQGLLENLPPRDEISDEYQAEVLDLELQRAKAAESDSDSDSLSDKGPSPSYTPPTLSHSPSPTPPPKEVSTQADLIEKLHYNLESRLQLFWSSNLPSRTIRLHLFTSPQPSSEAANHNSIDHDDHRPITTTDITTGVDGSFNAKLRLNWNDLCKHPRALHIAFGEPRQEHDLFVVAELLPPPTTSCSTSSLSSSATPSPIPSSSASHPHLSSHSHLHTFISTLSSSLSGITSFLSPSATASTHINIPITHCPIRIISDIDDTVKMSGVPDGARAVFQNVFMKELKDGLIPGMGEWYSSLWRKGVRFHYVSNGPFEYLPVLHEFFELSKLPPGSIKLKSYAGRSLFRGLLSTPATRKRAGVVDILDSFPDSKFILIGDSGEQDLELYADLARERQNQILAVLIRDAEELCYDPIDDPVGRKIVGAGAAGTRPGSEPLLDYSSTSSTSTRGDTARQEDHLATPRTGSMSKSCSEKDDTAPRYTDSPLSKEPADLYTYGTSDGLEEETPKAKEVSSLTDAPLLHVPGSPPSSKSSKESLSPLDLPCPTTATLPPPAPSQSNQYISSPPPPVPPPRIPSVIGVGTSGKSASDPAALQPSNSYWGSRSKGASESTRSSGSSSSSFSLNFRPNTRPGILPNGTGTKGGSSGSGGSGGKLTEGEKKRMELQVRVHRARTQMPSEVPLRVFRSPVECEEVDRLLKSVGAFEVGRKLRLDD